MRWLICVLAILAVLASLSSASAQSSRRVALVIGNGAYAAQGSLANPVPDSRLVADALRRAGFVVTAQTDLGKQGMERALRDFSRAADGAEVALVYYAGHGLEANGINWLLPVDAQLSDERDLGLEAISLDTVLGTVERARGLRMVVLDACRNNPFTRSMRRSATTRATVARGLADVEVTGTLVLYAARGGTVALDGAPGANSPFARSFARRIPEPGVDIRLLVSKVRDDVLAATNRAQEPFSYGSLPGVEMMLVSGTSTQAQPSPAAVELAVWQGALAANTVEAFRDYLRLYPNGQFRGLAEENISRATSSSRPAAAPQPDDARFTEDISAFLGAWSRVSGGMGYPRMRFSITTDGGLRQQYAFGPGPWRGESFYSFTIEGEVLRLASGDTFRVSNGTLVWLNNQAAYRPE